MNVIPERIIFVSRGITVLATVKYYTTAMMHIISQINADPRRLQPPYTNCHDALYSTIN